MPHFRKNEETIILNGYHSIIKGNVNPKVPLPIAFDGRADKNIEPSKFGLFDSSTPNYYTYYPDVSKEDFDPKDDEFIYPVYRLLSNVTVNRRFNPVYFPEDVLKRSMPLMLGQSIYIDHEMVTGNALGSVLDVFWQEASTVDGIKVPAGFNGRFKIDAKSNPRIARGINMDPPSVHSNSVTVTYVWEKSHKNLTDEEFFSKMGTLDKEGRMVQKVATEIVAYLETSLVPHGADPFAQKIGKNGNITNPIYANVINSRFSASEKPGDEDYVNQFVTGLNYKLGFEEDVKLSYYTTTIPSDNNNNNNSQKTEKEESMEQTIQFLATLFAIEGLTEQNLQQLIGDSVATLKNKVTGLETESNTQKETISNLNSQITQLTNEKASLSTDAEIGKEAMQSLRQEASRLYNLAMGEKTDENITNLINTGDYKTVKSLFSQYNTLAEGKFEATCQECGSHNVTRASASSNYQKDGDDGSKGDGNPKSNSDVIGKFVNSAGNIKPDFF